MKTLALALNLGLASALVAPAMGLAHLPNHETRNIVGVIQPIANFDTAKQHELPKNPNNGLLSGDYFNTGLIFGTIAETDFRGFFTNTWEIFFNPGGRSATDGSSSRLYQMSTLDADVFYKIKGLDRSKPWVLRYQESLIRSPLSRETFYNVVDFYPTYVGQTPDAVGIPLTFADPNPPTGSYGKGRDSGLLIKTQRWGTLWTRCVLTLKLSGTEKFRKYNLNSEEGCRYAESILPYGATVDVDYRQYYLGIMNYSRTVETLTVKQLPR